MADSFSPQLNCGGTTHQPIISRPAPSNRRAPLTTPIFRDKSAMLKLI